MEAIKQEIRDELVRVRIDKVRLYNLLTKIVDAIPAEAPTPVEVPAPVPVAAPVPAPVPVAAPVEVEVPAPVEVYLYKNYIAQIISNLQ